MEMHRVGRMLGIGTRVAAGKLRDGTARAAAAVERSATSAPVSSPPAPGNATPAPPRPGISSSAAIADGSRRMARGAGRFGASLWKPFAHATGLLGLQITGVFFALFGFVFAAHSWQLYKAAGWRDRHLPMYLVFAVLFAWFAMSSFWRASRKQKRG